MSYVNARIIDQLVDKHGDDLSAMRRDIKLNVYQWSEGQLRAMLVKKERVFKGEPVPPVRLKSYKQLAKEQRAAEQKAHRRAERKLLREMLRKQRANEAAIAANSTVPDADRAEAATESANSNNDVNVPKQESVKRQTRRSARRKNQK